MLPRHAFGGVPAPALDSLHTCTVMLTDFAFCKLPVRSEGRKTGRVGLNAQTEKVV